MDRLRLHRKKLRSFVNTQVFIMLNKIFRQDGKILQYLFSEVQSLGPNIVCQIERGVYGMRPCNTGIVQTIVRTSELDVLCYRPTSLTGLSAVFTSLARCKGFVLCVSAFVKPTTKTTVEHCEIKFVKQIVWQIKLNPCKFRVICFGNRFLFVFNYFSIIIYLRSIF